MMFLHGQTLYERNSNAKMYPASITKILTAIVVLENCNLDDTITISQEAIDKVEDGYITSNLKAGEEVTIRAITKYFNNIIF